MSYAFTVSETGLRLIKAYEGFFETPRTLTDGQEVIGFGHRLSEDDPRAVTEAEAETLLKADIADYEALINDVVHTSLTQSQFDALVSLAFSIGKDAFLNSDMLHALNQGEVIRAANGFDAWRLARIDEQVYVVDALVRRRTAEKALFLRPTHRIVRASRYQIQAQRDDNAISQHPVKPLETHNESDEDRNVPDVSEVTETVIPVVEISRPATLTQAQTVLVDTRDIADEDYTQPKTRDVEFVADESVFEDTSDNQNDDDTELVEIDVINPLELEVKDATDANLETTQETIEEDSSPIAEAAAEVSERLDALMGASDDVETVTTDTPVENIVDFKLREPEDVTIKPEALEARRDPARMTDLDYASGNDDTDIAFSTRDSRSIWALGAIIVSGLILGAIGLILSLGGAAEIFGNYGPFIAFVAIFIGALMIMGGAYYLIKNLMGFGKSDDVQNLSTSWA